MFDRLVGGAILSEEDAVMGPDVDYRLLHQGGQPDAGSHVVAEDQEGSSIGAYASMQGHSVHHRAHGMLADAEVHIARGHSVALDGVLVLHHGVVRWGEISGSANQLGDHIGNRVDDLSGGRPGRDTALGAFEDGKALA